MTQNLALFSGNLNAGTTLLLDCPNLPGGTLKVVAASPSTRTLPLTDALSDAGIPLTASATGGACGVSRTAGTSLTLVGEVTSSNAKTDKFVMPLILPSTFVAGGTFTISCNASVAGSGTLTGASTSLKLDAYSVITGVEAALSVATATQLLVAAGSTLSWVVTATGLSAGQLINLEFTGLVTSASGANTLTINSVSLLA